MDTQLSQEQRRKLEALSQAVIQNRDQDTRQDARGIVAAAEIFDRFLRSDEA